MDNKWVKLVVIAVIITGLVFLLAGGIGVHKIISKAHARHNISKLTKYLHVSGEYISGMFVYNLFSPANFNIDFRQKLLASDIFHPPC